MKEVSEKLSCKNISCLRKIESPHLRRAAFFYWRDKMHSNLSLRNTLIWLCHIKSLLSKSVSHYYLTQGLVKYLIIVRIESNWVNFTDILNKIKLLLKKNGFIDKNHVIFERKSYFVLYRGFF